MSSYSTTEITTDVLVVGGGIAAVFAAKNALNDGASVTLVDKGSIGRSGQSPFATGMAVFDEDEGAVREEWQANMLVCGQSINNPAYLDILMDYSKGVYQVLEEWGAIETGFGGVIRSKLMEMDINIIERTMITTLLEENGVVAGAVGFKLDKEEAVVINAKAVILCTGAGGFKPNGFQVRSLSFDGDAMAYRIGAKISGKEFVDTHVTRSDYPASCWEQWQSMWNRGNPAMTGGPDSESRDSLDLRSYYDVHDYGVGYEPEMPGGEMSEGEMSEGGQRPDGPPADGEMPEGEERPDGPPADGEMPTDGEMPEGEAPSGGGGQQASAGGFGDNPIGGASAGLSVHKSEGLFPSDNKCSTSITGLYAAGDCLSSMLVGPTYSGVGGFGFSGSATQGACAGETAAAYATSIELISLSDSTVETAITEMFEPLNNEQGYDPAWVEHMIQGTMIPYYVLYIKQETRLNSALTNIEFYRDHFAVKLKADDLHDLRKAHEVKNMLLNAEMKLRAGLFRTESRGNHYREDFPNANDTDWLAWVILQKGTDGSMELEKFLVDDFEALVV